MNNLQDFAHKRAVRHIPSINEPSLDFGALVDMVDVEDIAVCKIKLQTKNLEINHLANTLEKTNIQTENSDTEYKHKHHKVN